MYDQEEKKVPWSITEALFIFVIFMAIAFLASEIRFTIEYVLNIFSIELSIFGFFVFFSLIQFLIFILYIYYIVVIKYKCSLSVFNPVNYSFSELVKYGLLSSLLVFGATFFAALVMFFLFPESAEPQAIVDFLVFAESNKEMILVVIVTVFFAPVSEELFFRGFLYKALRNRLPVGLAIAISSVIFGAVHFDLYRFVPLFVAGVVLGHLYEKYKNLWIPIVAHGVWNGIMTMALFASMGS